VTISVDIQLAEAVKDALNAKVFSKSFQAIRGYRPKYELSDLKTLRVVVVPKGLTIDTQNRDKDSHAYDIDIGVLKKLDKDTNESIDPYMFLMQEIRDEFRRTRLAGFPSAWPDRLTNVPIYDPRHLDEYHQFTSVVTITYLIGR
jgi:hypothetical protein